MSLWSQPQPNKYTTRFHPGQVRAWKSEKRFIVVLAGTQSGKTSWGPIWLKREIDRCGPGDYLAVTASYDLFKLKMLPALRECFEHIYGTGRYWSGDRIIELADPSGRFWAKRVDDPMWGRIILRSAEAGSGLESNTAKAAWADEAGQDKFTLETWEAILRRLSLSQGRVLLTTTIYNMGWLKSALYDKRDRDPNIDVIQFDSIENPVFPRDEWERAEQALPRWKFDMFYRGRYTRPAGMIYSIWDRDLHTMPRFALPETWPRYGGLDCGGVHTAALRVAEEQTPDGTPTGRYLVYAEYLEGERTTQQHMQALIAGEPMTPVYVGGSHSEGQWRREFRAAGLPIKEPDQPSVEVGIDRVYGALATRRLIIFDDLTGLIGEIESYSRVLDSEGEPTEAIAEKSTYHRLDALRYIIGWLFRTTKVGLR